MRFIRRRRVVTALAATFVAASLAAPPGSATNFAASGSSIEDDGGRLYRANNKYHWFAYAPTAGPDIVSAVENTRKNDFEATDLVTSFHGTGVSDSTNWDVYVEKCYGCTYGYAGLHRCHWVTTYSDGRKVCNHSHVYFNGGVTDGYTGNQKIQVACHEVGHSVGLMHGTATHVCMRTDTNTGSSRWLGTHNRTHINKAY